MIDCSGRPAALLKDLFTRMTLIREAEEKIAALYPEQEMRCPTHLSIGQEAIPAAVCANLRKDDTVFLTHRCHAGYIAKGGDLNKMIAELYGKATGCTKGRGGSMHLVDPQAGLMGTSALLAASIPIACGSAFAFKQQKQDGVAVCFFGDAAVEEGTFSESLNLAALWSLPVVFVCENNGLSTCTPISRRQPSIPIAGRAEAAGIPAQALDGNDVLAVYDAASKAVARARQGRGPSFLECATYRWREHVGPNFDWDMGYRSEAEVRRWMAADPIKRFEAGLDAAGALPKEQRRLIREGILEKVEAAVAFAKKSPFPGSLDLEGAKA